MDIILPHGERHTLSPSPGEGWDGVLMSNFCLIENNKYEKK